MVRFTLEKVKIALSPRAILKSDHFREMKGEVSCFQYPCQSNTSSRRVCCRGHPLCYVRNREAETGKDQNIPQANYPVFSKSYEVLTHELASTSIFTQAVIFFWLPKDSAITERRKAVTLQWLFADLDLPSLSGAQANRGGWDPAQDPAPVPCLYVLSLTHEGHPWVKIGTVSTEMKS